MKIKFNVEISKKDGFKENHLNLNADVDITVSELKDLFNTDTKKDSNTTSTYNYTVAVCHSNISGNIVYAVRYNKTKENSLILPSILSYKDEMLLNRIDSETFNNFYETAVKIYDTNALEFLYGKKVKEV